MLHLATHGYFMDGDAATEWEVDYGMAFAIAAEHLTGGRLGDGRLGHPFLRSGLALAGANDWIRTGRVRPSWGDGLLTADELATLDLRGTQLVVFSACKSGRGAVRPGEAVIGLRRAARLAGARAQIMALAQIPDLAVALLMIKLYEVLREDGVTGDDALRRAQLHVRDVTVQQLRARFSDPDLADLIPPLVRTWLNNSELGERPFNEPRCWAPFIYVGPPARLEIWPHGATAPSYVA